MEPSEGESSAASLSKSAQKKLAARKLKEQKRLEGIERDQRNRETFQVDIKEPDYSLSLYGAISDLWKEERIFVSLQDLNGGFVGKVVWVRARLHHLRARGKLCFVTLRKQGLTMQGVLSLGDHVSKQMLTFVANLTLESILDVEASVAQPEGEISSCSIGNLELILRRVYVVSAASRSLPFNLGDAARQTPEYESPFLTQDLLLTHRSLSLRTPANQAIFRIKSALSGLFRDFFRQRDFVEIHTPNLAPESSPSASYKAFRLPYFGREAILHPSSQINRQMAIAGGFERVIEVGPKAQALAGKTRRHLCEFVSLDIEMALEEHYHELLDLLADFFLHSFHFLETRCAWETQAVFRQFPASSLRLVTPIPRLSYIRGEEVMSGTQRGNDPVFLRERADQAQAKGDIENYLNIFRYGCPPHAGASIGLERMVTAYLGLGNIRNSSLFPRDSSRLVP